MVIAVNMRLVLKDQVEGCGYFVQESFRIIAAAHPEHQFCFIFDRPQEPLPHFPANTRFMHIGPPARHPLLWRIWFDLRIPQLLRRIKADVFVSPDGYASLTTRVPQCLVVHDLGFLHYPDAYKKSHVGYMRRLTPRFIRKAAQLATVSQFSKNDIIKQYGTEPQKIDVVYNGVKEVFHPIDPSERQQLRDKFTAGHDFFIYVGALQPRKNLINLLKAFSIFKKRQQSNMKLVLTGRLAWKNEAFLEKLSSYKYKDDVVLTHYLDEDTLARLLASAYALVYPSLFEGFGVPVLEALRSGVPALTSKDSPMQEIAGAAGLYFDPNDHQDMADQLMRIYKDESLRQRMVEEGLKRAQEYSWQRTAGLLWDSVLKASRSV